MLLRTISHGSLGKTREKNYAVQHRNNSCYHRDPLRLADLYYRGAARAGRSYSSWPGDYFRRKRIPPRLGQRGVAPASRDRGRSRRQRLQVVADKSWQFFQTAENIIGVFLVLARIDKACVRNRS